MVFWCPDKVASSFQDDLSNMGAVCIPPIFPAVEDIMWPSADQERRLNIDMPIEFLKYE
jgi:hypothetical protein